MMKRIEKKWQKKWFQEKLYEPDFSHASAGRRKPFYNLMMFPYPSAEGLHIGAARTFSGVDIYGRFKRMQGHDVFEPIGLDGFGIHSENYALKIGKHPFQHAKDSEKNFYRQLSELGNGFAWKERLETYDPAYYQWTQWIFVQMFKHGLAYRKKAAVNWCPSCKTVLADEQVLQGECERCETAVIKKELEQWFFKITDYAERLLRNLDTLDWPEKIKIAQRNWIGKSEGALIKFKIKINEVESRKNFLRDSTSETSEDIEIFTTRPDTIFGATFLAISPNHPLADKKNLKAINPANGEEIPVFVADYVLGDVGTGAIMAVPAHDQRDFEFAKKYNLPIRIVVCPHYPEATCPILDEAYEGEGHLVASGQFDGMPSQEAKEAITKFVNGSKKVQYRLRDWLISRQRYWGPPIPMIYCDICGWQPVPEKDLPVKLPYIKDFRPTGTDKAPLATVEKFLKVRCPQCGAWARRETDVSDSFLDSSWYYIGYLMKFGNWKLPARRSPARPAGGEIGNSAFVKQTRRWLPVNMYIGGAEHAVLHLLYRRFVAMALHDWGVVDFSARGTASSGEEPFARFRAHGLITKDGAKMSKSKGNVVSPDAYIETYGADAVRMYLAFLAPFEEGGDFRDSGIKGITRFLDRAEKFIKSKCKNPAFAKASADRQKSKSQIKNKKLIKIIHKTIKKVTEDIEELKYNTAISALMVLLNAFETHQGEVDRNDIEIFLKLLAPFAPFLTEELWREKLGNKKSIHVASWPLYDQRFLEEETYQLIVEINGKMRDTIEVIKDITQKEAERAGLASSRVKPHLEGKKIKKVIFIPNRLINFVV